VRGLRRAREVLARLDRADGEHVVAVRARTLGHEARSRRDADHADMVGLHAE
jgi:hypothetical protein